MSVRIEGAMDSPHFKAPLGIALSVHPDEKAYQLFEVNVHAAGHRGWRRAQVIYVNRGDKLARWARDLGPMAAEVEELDIPSLWVHSVAQLQDMAETLRHDDYWSRFMDEEMADTSLIVDALDQYHERRRLIRNQSTYGPGGHKQRIGFPTGAVRDMAKEIVNGNRNPAPA